MGTLWDRSGDIERDNNDARADGALAYFFVGGTTTPLTVYQDAAESTPHTHPLEADGNGRWPAVFIPFTASFDFKVTTEAGTQLYYYTLIPNPNPVEAAADTVDDTQLIQTGDIIFAPSTGTRTGFVRANGRTIGSAASGATERANADCEDLYTYNWNNFADGILPVTGGRGATAAADWAANKPIALLDGRSGVLRGVDDMGNSAASALTLATFTTGNATTGGSVCGANTHTLTTAQLASHTHTYSGTSDSGGSFSGSTGTDGAHSHSITDPGHDHNVHYNGGAYATGGTGAVTAIVAPPGSTFGAGAAEAAGTDITVNAVGGHTHTITISAHTHTYSGTTASNGSGDAHNNVSKSILGSFYQKL